MLSDEYLGELLRAEMRDATEDIQPSAEFMERLMPKRRFRLLHELSATLRPSRPAWVLAPSAGLLAAIAAVLVIVLGSSGAQPAYAVDFSLGNVVITLRQVAAIGPLNRKLERLGLRIRAVAMTDSCTTVDPNLIHLAASYSPRHGGKIILVNEPLPAGLTRIVAVASIAHGELNFAIGSVTGRVPSCVSTKGGTAAPGMPGFVPTKTDATPTPTPTGTPGATTSTTSTAATATGAASASTTTTRGSTGASAPPTTSP